MFHPFFINCNKSYCSYCLTLILLMWRIGWAPNSIPIYIQQDVTLHSLFISENCSTCFGWYFHPSSWAHTTASTASGICHTVTAICRYRGRVGTGLSVLWVAYATRTRDLLACRAVRQPTAPGRTQDLSLQYLVIPNSTLLDSFQIWTLKCSIGLTNQTSDFQLDICVESERRD
jgi:hypothetical protein